MLNNSPDVGREAFDFIESIQRLSATGGIMQRLRAVFRRSMPDRLQARVGKFEYVRLAAMTAAFQQFGRFHPLQIISRVDDAGIDFLSRLHAEQRQPADGRVLLHNLCLYHAFTTSLLIWIKKIQRDRVLSPAIGKFLDTGKTHCGRGPQARLDPLSNITIWHGCDMRSKLATGYFFSYH